jgi:hypothetical protein
VKNKNALKYILFTSPAFGHLKVQNDGDPEDGSRRSFLLNICVQITGIWIPLQDEMIF